MPRKVIGIAGRAGCGKNTLADMIADAHMSTTWICAFADALRDVVEVAFGSRYETQEEKAAVDPFWEARLNGCDGYGLMSDKTMGAQPITGRRILQFVGTEMFRNLVHPQFWCMVMERRLQAFDSLDGLIIIPDVRFANEANLVRKHGTLIHLFRDDLPLPAEDEHVSECPIGWEKGDETVHNQSLDQLRTQASIIARMCV